MSLREQIESGLFKEAKKGALDLPPDELETLLIECSYDSSNMCFYLFIQYLIFEKNTADLQSIAATLLIISYPHINGAYSLAYKHMKLANDLAPQDPSYKEGLGFFSDIPDDVID
ncbi:hypothetical protein I6N95_22165 [Vagococcus sp. BWB3-3]|uniref:Uncharacterized protein n=1 Tax=Vagococcus allomyrinae TaxID=2794353 RepID=A0A940SYT9_9ENTE|nr:hypothetical protein [Vagococcus allomyrinae]MBP1043738.1 hypothetical protein [Vagococcus allomyrinae]